MAAKLKSAVLGASGYSGLELTRLLERHPRLEKPLLMRRENGGNGAKDLAEIFPELSGNGGYPLQALSWPELKRQGVELLFLATPHEASRALVPEAAAQGLRVIDLSGAWRLKHAPHRAIYGFEDADAVAAAELTRKAVYGLPELNGDCIAKAQLVANPGCYATSVILALVPLVKAGLIDREHGIISDSKSGVSGAGKTATSRTHFVSVADNLSAYSVFEHRHLGEMAGALGNRGCGADIYATPAPDLKRGHSSFDDLREIESRDEGGLEVEACLRDFYAGKHWVRIFATPKLPQVQFSLHSNYCDPGFCLAQDGRRLVLVSCVG